MRWPDVDPSAVVRHLYVHVPFCPTVCPFCSFHVVEGRTNDAVERYLSTLDRELAEAAERVDLRPDTVYLGGGTPSYLRPAEMERLRDIVDRRVGWSPVEATLEVHPSTATAERVDHWRTLGFNRLSVGAQSFDDDVLGRLGRPHDAATARRAVDWCVASGGVTSVDLIIAVPGVDPSRVASDVDVAIAAGVDHVSAYTLTVEPGTPFDLDGMTADDDQGADERRIVADALAVAGFEQYEPSNHARPGARCAHNVAYWTHEWFVGVGPAATSLLPLAGGGAVRWAAPPSGAEERMVGEDLASDMIVSGLRLREGIDVARVQDRTGVDLVATRAAPLRDLVRDGLAVVADGRIAARPAGVEVLDAVTAALL